MNEFLQWALDLQDIRLGEDAPILLKWQNPFEPWLGVSLALMVALCLVLIYRREPGSKTRRIVLGSIRFALVLLVGVLLCRPTLVLQKNREEPSYIALLVDTSRSMSFVDSAATGNGQREARLDVLREALLRDNEAALKALFHRNQLELYSFAGHFQSEGFVESTEQLSTVTQRLQSLVADGQSSDIGNAIERALDDASGRRIAAIVLASDGQATDENSVRPALELARARNTRIYPIRIGSPVAPIDVEVGPLTTEPVVFVNDLVSIVAGVSLRGSSDPVDVVLRLVDDQTGAILGTESTVLSEDASQAQIELYTVPTRAGVIRYRVEIAPLADERTPENNADYADITVLSDKLRVLYVEGYPRYEYRYLKNALVREESMDVSVLLLEADEAFVQEGTTPIRRFPETPEELRRYDVILMGDVDPRAGWLTSAQITMLLDYVANGGGGFGVIAGERSAPYRYRGTELEKLLPVRIDPDFLGRYEGNLTNGFRPVLTPEGRRSRIFRFTGDPGRSESMFESLPELYWIARTLGPRPGATVLAEHPGMTVDSEPMPLVATGRYGAGKLFFQATDDTWRWRRHVGELLHDAYWIRVTRDLVQPDRMDRENRYALRTDRRTYTYGEPVRALIQVFDGRLLAELRDTIEVTAHDIHDSVVERFEARRISPESDLFEATFVPPGAGRFTLQAASLPAQVGSSPPEAAIRVEDAALELRRFNANHELLMQIASQTDGEVVELRELADQFATIRSRSAQVPDDTVEPLWDSRLALILFGSMITIEWIVRKAFTMT